MSWINFAQAIVLAWMATASVCAWAVDGYLHDAVGSVSVAMGKDAPRPAVKNDTVAAGSVIRTGNNSSAVLKFSDGQVVSMQANSTLQVREYIYEPDKVEGNSAVFSVFKGGMRFITGEIGQGDKKAFKLVLPNTTIRIRGTEFMVVMANNATYSQVISGSISMTNAAGTAVINAGQTALTSSATALASVVPAASVPAGIFSQVAAIPVPLATPIVSPAQTLVAAPTRTTAVATATAGGAAPGGAAASTAAAGGMFGGFSATTIGIGVGVAAAAAAVINNTSSTTQH